MLHFRKHGYSAGQYHHEKNLQSFYDREEEIGGKMDAMDHLKHVLSLVDNMELDGQSRDNPEQLALLQKKKIQAKSLLRVVLKKVGEYLETIARMDNIKLKKNEYEPDVYRRMFMEIDQIRKISHEALMSDINIVNRFIMKNFGNSSDEIIEVWGDEELKAGRQFLSVKRVDFSNNVICPDDVDLSDRDQIRKWAIQIEGDLSELKNGL